MTGSPTGFVRVLIGAARATRPGRVIASRLAEYLVRLVSKGAAQDLAQLRCLEMDKAHAETLVAVAEAEKAASEAVEAASRAIASKEALDALRRKADAEARASEAHANKAEIEVRAERFRLERQERATRALDATIRVLRDRETEIGVDVKRLKEIATPVLIARLESVAIETSPTAVEAGTVEPKE